MVKVNVKYKEVSESILSPIKNFGWETLIVPILKWNGGQLRICGDCKVILNPALKVDNILT